MLIGIDMLGVQSPEGGRRETGRLGRQLVLALLAGDPAHRYVLYTHEGMPTHRVPSARNSHRVSLATIRGGSAQLRPTIQRVIDQNPDGLDWLILLDPFEPNYGGMPPESPLSELKIASLIVDLAPTLADDRRLAPLRRHDAILAVSEATASECRRRLGSASWRVSTLGVACDPSLAALDSAGPMTRASGEELGRLGITGPFLFANMVGGTERANLGGILEAYQKLPFEQRSRHQLVVAGRISDPWGVIAYLHARGCAEGLVLVGEVEEQTLRMLYGRCSSFISPSIDEGACLSLVEAMSCGAAILAGRAGAQPEIVGDAALLVDPTKPAEIANQLALLLSNNELGTRLRKRALARSFQFGWEPVVQGILATLTEQDIPSTRPRFRVDYAHVARPRIAIFPGFAKDKLASMSLDAQIPAEWRDAYNIDLYLDPGQTDFVDGLPPEFGGFDSRQFDRNDGILSYHAVAYRFQDLDSLESKLGRLRSRPGLIFLNDDGCLDRLGWESAEPGTVDCDPAIGKLREVFLTSSRLVVRSPWHFDRIKACLPGFVDQLVEIPPTHVLNPVARLRPQARTRLDLLPESVVIGHFGSSGGAHGGRLSARYWKAVTKAVPDAIHLPFEDLLDRVPRERRPGRPLVEGPESLDEMIAVLDVAVFSGPSQDRGPVALIDLLRAGVPTIVRGRCKPGFAVHVLPTSAGGLELGRALVRLASDPESRLTLGRLARTYACGSPDPTTASALLLQAIERSAAELPRGSGRRQRQPAPSAVDPASTPHTLRPASTPSEATSTPR